jgi:hypothetical protein
MRLRFAGTEVPSLAPSGTTTIVSKLESFEIFLPHCCFQFLSTKTRENISDFAYKPKA